MFNLQQIIRDLGIDKPILNTQLIDQRLKIYLYGGQTIDHIIQPTPPALTPELSKLLENPPMYGRSELRLLAQALGIDGALEMNKRPLIDAINAWKQEHAG